VALFWGSSTPLQSVRKSIDCSAASRLDPLHSATPARLEAGGRVSLRPRNGWHGVGQRDLLPPIPTESFTAAYDC
jgi:hypothetical protein